MSDPDLDLIQGAAGALNATDARINGFLDSVDDEVDQRLDAAQATLLVRQQAYDTMANNLEGVVLSTMERQIDWLPNEAANNPVNGGHVRTWAELVNFINTCPPGSNVIVRMQDGDHHFSTSTPNHLPFLGSLTFLGIGSTVAGSRPRIVLTPADAGNSINASPFMGPNNSVLRFEKVDIDLGTAPNVGGAFHSGNMWLRLYGITDLQLSSVKVFGDAPYLARVYTGAIVRATLSSVEVDKATLFAPGGILLLYAGSQALTNGAALHSGFTLGTDLLET